MDKNNIKKNNKKEKKSISLKDFIDKKTLATLVIVYFLFFGLPWIYENKDKLLGKETDFIIKIPYENFGVEPNLVLNPYGFDIIPKDKNKVVNVKNAVCYYNWENFELEEETKKDTTSDNGLTKETESSDASTDKEFKPMFPLPIDSPRRLFCPAVKLPDKPGEYSFSISVESEEGKETTNVKFYVTKPLGKLET